MNSKMKCEIGDYQRDGKYTVGLSKKINGVELGCNIVGNSPVGILEKENVWSELRLQVSKLMEENLWQQAELMWRNDEKRKAIKDLCLQPNQLINEKRTLLSCLSLRSSKVGTMRNQSQLSRLKGLILRKIWRRGSS
ncbi:hypothetical protein HHK36_015921 [Tetracentron sinense]|uniref:Uncharacterized protein n=1 Tax=Tetracentron sinense TaxID=13715 RepID=A0A834Z711_TETSI|nr:hypothetical protein HHK36_015921 [Tetracentron sinense]